ncbi:type 1 glutamine amidotransferase [Phaeobacter sp. 11ANDIMAR09]|uniref:type 1 glutamine amidotransferase n=1 Tax=Phaeobacter sp. 11ANDIMAR09 TaxID=1225647 RepID=UPI0006C86313|nr:type 1 glutamine amidotransferase [Phaeobacter sp. 11ANDIMAR09]KPD11113.1 glutamine amidotransferase [Phaeobacter sp. 11ANDIMAR09]
MKIGILQTGHAPDDLIRDSGDYDQMFCDLLAGQGFEFETFSVLDGIFPADAEAADGWIITGSRHGVYEPHDWIPPLEELIRQIHARKQPLAGICFGHQIIAQALGGKVAKFDGGWAVGPVTYQQDGKPLTLNAWHQDQVIERPAEARVLAGNDFCENGILAYGDHIWTLQPHPEFSNEFTGGLIEKRGRGVVPDPLLDQASRQLDTPVDSPAIATFLADFMKKERT